MTLLEEACELLKTARLEAGIACPCSPRRINGKAACMHTQQIDDINAWLARAAEAGDQGADVEARTVAAIAAWLDHGLARDLADRVRKGAWRTR